MALSKKNARDKAFVVALKYLEANGFEIFQCEPYNRVTQVHETHSWHYDSFFTGGILHSRAADINWPGGGKTERKKIGARLPAIRTFGVAIIFDKTGDGDGPTARHRNHAHLDQGSYTNLGSGKKKTKKSDLTVYSTQKILHTLVKDMDNVNGDDTARRIKLVRQASLLGGVDFPSGVEATQRVIGADLTGEWDLQSRLAHDTTVKNLKKRWKNAGLYHGEPDAVWDKDMDLARSKFHAKYK